MRNKPGEDVFLAMRPGDYCHHRNIRASYTLALIKNEVYKYRKIAIASIIGGFVVNLFFFTWGTIAPDQYEPKSSFIPAVIVSTLVVAIGLLSIKKS